MKRSIDLKRVGLSRLLLAVCLCLVMTVDSSLAKRKGGRGRRGRSRNPAQRAAQQNREALRHNAKHTGVHIKIGEDKQGLKKIGVSGSDIRAMHERNMASASGGGAPVIVSDQLKTALAIKKMREAEEAEKRKKGGDGVLILNER